MTVHAGDTVAFKLTASGDPHTITLGKLIDAGLAAVKDPTAHEPPALAKLPNLLPPDGGDAPRSAARPCYIAPGTYRYLCLFHRALMTGKITVVAGSKTTEAPMAAAQRGATELNALVAKLKPSADTMQPPPFAQALAGNLSQKVLNGEVNHFGSKSLSVPVGGSVTWLVLGPHTISFNPTQEAKGIRVNAPDGPHLNQRLFAPAGGPGAPPPNPSAPPPAPNTPPAIADGGTWDGNGFRNSGAILSFPPAAIGCKLTFSKAAPTTTSA